MVAQDDSGGNETNQTTVFANQHFDMTKQRMTFDGCIAVQAADTINGNSTGTRPHSSRQMSYSGLRLERSTKLYNKTALFRTCAHSSLISLQQASVGSKVEPFNTDSKRTCDSFLSTKYRRVQNNKTVLDRACTQSHGMSLQQLSVGSKVEQFNIDSKRTDEQLRSVKLRRVQDPIDLQISCKGPLFGTPVSQSDGRKEEMEVVLDDAEIIQVLMDATQINRVMMYTPVLSATNGKGIKTNYKPKPEATPNVVEEEFMPCPSMPSTPEAKAQECILSPSAPQVEKNVLETSSSSIKSAKLASTEKPRTRSTARAERFTILAPRHISDDEYDKIYTVVPKPYGFSASFHEYKPPEDCTCDDKRVFNEALRKAHSSRTYPPHLCVKGRKKLGMLMSPRSSTSVRTNQRRRGYDQSATRPWRMAPTSPPGGVFRHKSQPLRGRPAS